MNQELDQELGRLLDGILRERVDAFRNDVRESFETTLAAASSSLHGQLAKRLESEFGGAANRAAAEAQQRQVESAAEAVRRIRAESDVTGIAGALVDAASAYCSRTLLLIHRADQLLGFRAAGACSEKIREGAPRLAFPLSEAGAIAHAVESLDRIATTGAAGQVSPALAELFELSESDQVRLFPVRLRDKVLAILYCDGHGRDDQAESTEEVVEAGIETLVLVAEAWIEAVSTRKDLNSSA